MIYSASTNKKPAEAHTVGEFIELGNQSRTNVGYRDISYIEKRNGIEFTVKNLIDDYWYELMQASKVVPFSDKSVRKYRYNPKLLAHDLYGNTRLYYVILRLNGMCNVHDFTLENKNVRLLEPEDIVNILIPRVIKKYPQYAPYFDENIIYHINPTGIFVIGGPHGDTGLTGRKIIVDTYGGKGAHGGGAFSGKDPSKVDRSAAYAMRHIAKNLVAAGVADEILVQVSYAIGVAEPTGVYVNTYGTAKVNLTDGEIAKKIQEIFPLRPYDIEQRLKLRNPIYSETASYGHMGRTPKVVTKVFSSPYHRTKKIEVELFTWEKLDYVDKVKETFFN